MEFGSVFLGGQNVSILDVTALLWFLACWFGYAYYAERRSKQQGKNLVNIMNQHRHNWMKMVLRRENRIADVSAVGNLLRSIAFFASTTILILLGLSSLLGGQGISHDVLATVPFVAQTSLMVWDIKILLLITIFIYAFFKYTWSLRQYNYVNILVVAAPVFHGPVSREEEEYAHKAARLVANAARHFNYGLRAYYFGMSVLSWFIHPLLLIVISTFVVWVIYRREFLSNALNTMIIDGAVKV